MAAELSKAYSPSAVEAEAYRVWMEQKCFEADPSNPGEPYCIVIPPPNVTGALHLGHAINDTLQDILIRKHRMAGFNTLWVPGIDHAGIATQAMVEKQLKEQENKTRHDVGREGLVERIWKWKQQFGDRILEQLKRLGCSCDWSRTHFTLDEQCAAAVRETFFKLFKDGLIYRGKRLVNWDVHLQTSISDDEIYHETVKTSLWHIKYRILDEAADVHPRPRAKFVTVATTRPETLLGDTAVAVHSQDPRWNWAIGKFVELPLTGRKIPIIADDILVDPKFGSGVVKVTPAHDPNDYAVWQRQAGKIEILNILNPNGTLNENAGPAYAGMKRDAAREKVVQDLVAAGLLEKEEPYETQVGHSDRSKTPVEPYLSDQWFVHMAPLAEPALQVVREGIIKFFPERHAQQYLSWLGEKRDWPISRQLWWGHRIPVWTRRVKSVQRESVYPNLLALFKSKVSDSERFAVEECDKNIACQYRDAEDDGVDLIVCVKPWAGLRILEDYLGQSGFVQDPDVLDTWFSSALWPHSTLGWPEKTADLEKWYPTSVLLTGRDIITLWVARMVMMGMYNMGQSAPIDSFPLAPGSAGAGPGRSPGLMEGKRLGIPFLHVAINPTILDGKGERMSKSKGNGVDPVDIIETHGADALRFTLTSMATETQDVRLPVKKDSQGRNTSDRFDVGRNFCNKLWNATRFALSSHQNLTTETQRHGEEKNDSSLCLGVSVLLSLPDRWITSRFNRAIDEANAALAIYRFDQYAKICYDFFWRDFCDWYVEAIKPTLKTSGAGKSKAVLAAVLDGALRLMHPMIPFITETIWWQLNETFPSRGLPGILDCPPSPLLIRAVWPKAGNVDDEAERAFSRLQEIIVAIRNVRNEAKVDAKKSVNVRIEPSDREIDENRPLIESLSPCTIVRQTQSGGEAVRVSAGGCDIFVEGLASLPTEGDSQARQCAALRQRAEALRGRLANPSYASKAPPHLVQQTRDELAAAEAEMVKLGCEKGM